MTTFGQPERIFVGRHQEISDLDSALADAIAGRGRVVMLAGEPGIGKTSIAQEVTSRAQGLGAQVFWGWCYEREGAPPYWPWVQPIQSYVSNTAPEQLRTEMGSGASDIADIVPEVRGKLPDLELSPSLDPQQTRFRLFNSIATFLSNLAKAESLVLVLDDLHWADTPSLLLLEFLAQQIADSKILVIGTYRDIEVSPQHPLSESLARLTRNPAFSRLALGGLGTDDVGLFVRESGGENAPPGLIKAIHTHTEGNPLFLSEVVRLLGEREGLGTSTEAGAPIVLGLPQGVIEVIGQRLNRLSADCVDALTTAAAIGRQFDFNLLRDLSEDVTEIQLLEQVEEALDAHIVQELPGQGDNYQFSHAMVQQTLLERLSTSRRVRMHARIGEQLEARYGDDPGEHAAEPAYHFSESMPVTGEEKLAKYSRLAGEKALEGYAWEESLSYFQNGLKAMSVDVDGAESPPDEESAGLLFGLGRAQFALLDEAAFRSLQRSFDYYAGSGDIEKVVAIAELPDYSATRSTALAQLITPALALVPPGSLQAARLLSRLGQIIGLQEAAFDEAIEALNQALEISQREGDKGLEVQTLVAITSVYSNHMYYDESLENSLKIFELNEHVHDLRSEVAAHYFAVTAMIENGDLGEAKRHASEMIGKSERLGDRFWLESAYWKSEMSFRLAGEWDDGRVLGHLALEIGSRPSNIIGGLALLEHEVGNSPAGDNHIEYLAKAAREGGTGSRQLDLAVLARAALIVPIAAKITGSGDHLSSAKEAARRTLENPQSTALWVGQSHAGLAMIAVFDADQESAANEYAYIKGWRSSLRFFSISSDRLLGLVARTMGEIDQAAAHFEDALSFCKKGGYRPELAWAGYDYAVMLLDQDNTGDQGKASRLIEESAALADELGMGPLTDQITALGDTSRSQHTQTAEFPDGLTIREVEVIRLVALGKTDREIADELFISFRTVGNHVRSILNKTSAANRTEADAYAALNGLTVDPG